MKRKIIIGLIIILNLTFVLTFIMIAIFGYGLIVAEVGIESGLEIAYQVSIKILIYLVVIGIIVTIANYFLFNKLKLNQKPILTSIFTTLAGIIIFTPFFLNAKQSFLNYQFNTTKLRHYLEYQEIEDAHIIFYSKDTVKVDQLNDFIEDIGSAKYKQGSWKYIKTINIILKMKNGLTENIYTDGEIFGAYKGKFFYSDKDIIKKYMPK